MYLFGGLQKSAGGGPWVSAILRRTANSLDPSLVASHTVILGPQGGTGMETELRSNLCTLSGLLADSGCSDVFPLDVIPARPHHIPHFSLCLFMFYTSKIFLYIGTHVLKPKHLLS